MWPDFMTDADVGFPIFRIIAEDWFGYRIRPNGSFDTKPHPNKPTGMWDGYQGNVERIIANVLVRCLEVSLGLDHDAPLPTAAPPRSWPIYFFFKCQQPFFEGWVTWQCHSVNRRAAGQVTVMFATPGHNHPVSDHPVPIDHRRRSQGRLRADIAQRRRVPRGTRSRRRPQIPNGQPHQGVWVVTHRDHKKLNVFDTSVPSAYLEWGPPLLPIIAPENFCDVVMRATRSPQRRDRRSQAGVRGAMSNKGQHLRPRRRPRRSRTRYGRCARLVPRRSFRPRTDRSASRPGAAESQRVLRGALAVRGPTRRPDPRFRPHLDRGDREHGVGVGSDTGREPGARQARLATTSTKLLRSGTVVFHRFIDWLAVFAQIGVLHLGRPMSIGDIRFVAPDRGMSRRPGYNDECPLILWSVSAHPGGHVTLLTGRGVFRATPVGA